MRTTTTFMKVAMTIAIVAIALFGVGLPALAQTGPPELGDPTSDTQVVPHGGYSSLTEFCLQCHQVHYDRLTQDAPGEYALMAESSVTATCATCHGFEGAAPTGAEDPGFGGLIGTASTRAVYTQPEEVHIIGAGFGTVGSQSGWDFYNWGGAPPGPEAPGSGRQVGTASAYAGGLYCGSCHTPHGEFGQLINSQWAITTANQAGGANPVASPVAVAWAEGARIWWEDPTPASPPGVPQNANASDPWKQVYLHDAGAYWQVCATVSGVPIDTPDGVSTCEYAQVNDAEDQLVSLYGYKLLSSSPNHQYPYKNASGQFTKPDGTLYGTGATPPSGLYSDAPFAGGTLARNVGTLNLLTHSAVGTLTFDIGPVATSIDVNETVTGTSVPTVPFKIRIDDEILMVTGRTAPVAPSTTATYTVARAVEPFEPEVACRPWGPTYSSGVLQFDVCAGVAHTQATEVLLVPTLLVNEDSTLSVAQTLGNPSATPPTSGNPNGLKPLASYASTSRVAVPFHIKVTAGTPAVTEMMVVLWRTQVSGTQYLYTVGRTVDGTPSITATAGNGATFYVQSGVQRNSVRSWGVDRYAGDMSSFCGSCHGGPVDVRFGGQYHSHPTGCAECHGNSATSGNDFPHSSDNVLMLQELPDGLCINCHTEGTLP